jgi:hypothetical protein
MAEDTNNKHEHKMTVNINAKDTPILYTDIMYVSSSDYGVTLDFAQRVGPSEQQQVVARLGMSTEHARKMIEVIQDHLEKHER